MKKNLLVKVIISFVMLTLLFSLAACKKPVEEVITPPEEATAMEQLIGIIKGADGLVKALNGIDGNFNVDADISVNKKTSDDDDTYVLGVKGNLNNSSPELLVNFKSNDTENVAIGYKSSKLYIKQPLTAVNMKQDGSAADDSDAIVVDITALSPSVGNLMAMVMSMLADVNIPLDFDKLGEDLEGFVGEIGSLDDFIIFKEITNGNRLEVSEMLVNTLKGVVLKEMLAGPIGSVGNMLINNIFDTNEGLELIFKSNVFIEVYKNSEATINGVKLGFAATDGTAASITIDLNKFNNSATDKATITFGDEYEAKSLNLNVGATLPQKSLSAVVDATVTPDFSVKNKVIASGGLSFFDPNGAEPNSVHEIPAYFDGSSAFFNTAGAYSTIEQLAGAGTISAPENTLYKASVYKTTTSGTESTTLVDMINQKVADLKAEFDTEEEEEEEESGPSKGIMHKVYELLGGELTKETNKDGKLEYVKITEANILQQINIKVGDYTRFVIYEKDKTDSYGDVFENIEELFNHNKDWIIGTTTSQASGDYGIFNWSKDNWNGGATLYKADADNDDLLYAVNVFLQKEDKTSISTTDVADFCNYYVSMLYYYILKEEDPTAPFVTDVEDADRALLLAKNLYIISSQNAAAKTALETAKTNYKTAMENAIFGTETNKDYFIPNALLSGLLGVSTTEDPSTTNVLKDLIEDGVYVGIGCTKGQGINGALTIAESKDQAVIYLTLSGKLSLTDTVAAATIEDVTNAVEIAKDFVAVDGTEEFAADYKKIAVWTKEELEESVKGYKNTKKVIIADGQTKGDFIYEMDGENFVYNNRNENAENLMDELFNVYMGYLNINFAYNEVE